MIDGLFTCICTQFIFLHRLQTESFFSVYHTWKSIMRSDIPNYAYSTGHTSKLRAKEEVGRGFHVCALWLFKWFQAQLRFTFQNKLQNNIRLMQFLFFLLLIASEPWEKKLLPSWWKGVCRNTFLFINMTYDLYGVSLVLAWNRSIAIGVHWSILLLC
jgi:hypothetical protein